MDRPRGSGGAGLYDGYGTPEEGSVTPRYPVPGAERTVPLGLGAYRGPLVGRDRGLVLERTAVMLGKVGTGGTGGAGDDWRSRGLYAVAIDSEFADESVAVRLRVGFPSDQARLGSLGF